MIHYWFLFFASAKKNAKTCFYRRVNYESSVRISSKHSLKCSASNSIRSQMYINHNEYQELLDELEQTRKTRKGANITEEQKRIAANCLDFFEPVYVLIKSNAITMAQIDDLFCYRFFALVNNPIVQDCVIRPYHLYYSNIAKLHKEWTRFIIRSSKNKKVPYFETDLSKKPWYKEML